jgi:ATP-dependent NAD(P)H-hydrate dehydratase
MKVGELLWLCACWIFKFVGSSRWDPSFFSTCPFSITPSALVEDMVDIVAQMIDSLHVLVIGPGLGRCPLVLEAASQIIRIAMERNLALVLDADALFLLTLPEYHNLLQTPPSSVATSIVVLTPNAMELQRLEDMDGHWDKDRVIVVQKGQIDVVSYYALGQANEIRCSETGGFKRSGGIGDLLAGTVGTFLAWNSIMTKSGTASRLDAPLACWMACCLIKRSTKEAFQQHHRAMTAPDVLRVIGPTFSKMTQ